MMSGNMSFLNVNSGTGGGGQRMRDVQQENYSQPNGISNFNVGRGSLSFSSMGSPSVSFNEDNQPGTDVEVIKDTDVWGTRMILSSIEDIVFSESPSSQLPSTLIEALQKLILSVNTAVTDINSFVDRGQGKSLKRPVSVVNSFNDSYDQFQDKPLIELSKDVLDVLENASTDEKAALRTLVASNIKSTALRIIEIWKPILKANGTDLTYSQQQSSSRIPVKNKQQKRPVENVAQLTLADYNVAECLETILSILRTYQQRSQTLDLEIRDVLKKRNEEVIKYRSNVKVQKEIIHIIFQEKAALEGPSFLNEYMDVLELESKCLTEHLRLEKLRSEAVENPEDTQKETQEMYERLKLLYDKLENETLQMEEDIEKYTSLESNDEYLKILKEYQQTEEEIKTKEWVLDQLQQAPNDDSLLNDDSFYF